MSDKPIVGDLIQIKPKADATFGGCVMTVDSVEPWGVQCSMVVPTAFAGPAYYRAKWGEFEACSAGRAVFYAGGKA